tara:strand:+ start:218 stop:493 length:276 start_codon:yes stop_codon:yes gene_type:complete
MLTNLIYLIVFLIFLTVITIAVKAVNRGIDAKKNKQKDFNELQNINSNNYKIIKKNDNKNIINQINELNKFHSKGILTDEEFKKAKEKLLK